VVAEAPTNTLIISEVASRIDSLVAYARSFDQRPQQVNIKVQVISINRTNTQTLGVSYDIGSPQTFFNSLAPRTIDGAAPVGEFQVTLGGDAFAGVANAGRPHAAGAAINLLYNTTIGNFSLTSFVDALAQDELADIHASPSVNILDKKLSRLFVGASTSYLLTPQTAAGAIQSQPPIVSTLETGITLEVTPSISANRTVRLTVNAEQSTLLAITVAGPNASKRQVSGEVVVNDGETMVIAGLTQSQVTKTRSGIPLLMNLPVLGRLFSQNRTEDRQDDLLILITPHILDDPIPAGTARRD
jgi:type II secretory pathway component GspD/PulD (secretin)